MVIGVLVVLGLGIVYFANAIFQERHMQGTIRLANGHKYTYWIGDDLQSGYGGTLTGIDIELPKEFPHLYLDSQKGGGRLGRFVIDGSQRLSLEGDFDQHFQLYAPRRYETLALSIISPDVMNTIMGSATAYDVELYGSHLRLISNKRVYKSAARRTQLLAVGEKILAEVDQRLQSWSHQESMRAGNEDLVLYPMRSVRLFGAFVPWQFLIIEVAWVLLAGLFLWVGAMTAFAEHHTLAGAVISVGAIALLAGLTKLNWMGVKSTGFRSR